MTEWILQESKLTPPQKPAQNYFKKKKKKSDVE